MAGFVVICLFALVALLDMVPVPYRDAGGLSFSRTALDVIAKKPVDLLLAAPGADGRPQPQGIRPEKRSTFSARTSSARTSFTMP